MLTFWPFSDNKDNIPEIMNTFINKNYMAYGFRKQEGEKKKKKKRTGIAMTEAKNEAFVKWLHEKFYLIVGWTLVGRE